jgi:hypothetical protein
MSGYLIGSQQVSYDQVEPLPSLRPATRNPTPHLFLDETLQTSERVIPLA